MSRTGASLLLHLLDIFHRHQREGRLRRQFGLQPPLTLFLSINATAKQLRVGVSTVHRLKQQMAQAA